jgi:hypothetical protein
MNHKYLIDRINLEWINQILTILSGEMSVQEIVNISKYDGVDFGERRDVFNRLVDLNILIKRREGNSTLVEFTTFGESVQRLFIKSPDKIPFLFHMLHIIKSFEENSPRYFTTYRFVVETIINDKAASSSQYYTVVKKLEEKYNDDESITGMDKSTILKGVVFVQEVLNETFDLLDFTDPNIFTYGLQQYIERKTKSEMGSILIAEEEKDELSILFLLDKTKIDDMIQKSIRFKKAFTIRYAPRGMVLQAIKPVSLS